MHSLWHHFILYYTERNVIIRKQILQSWNLLKTKRVLKTHKTNLLNLCNWSMKVLWRWQGSRLFWLNSTKKFLKHLCFISDSIISMSATVKKWEFVNEPSTSNWTFGSFPHESMIILATSIRVACSFRFVGNMITWVIRKSVSSSACKSSPRKCIFIFHFMK